MVCASLYRPNNFGERLTRGWPESPPLPKDVREIVQKRFLGTIAPQEADGNLFLQHFCKAVRHGRKPTPDQLLAVVEGLEKILAGATAGVAFGLNRGRGNKRTEDRQLRDKLIDAEVDALRQEWVRGKFDDAIHLVAKRYNLAAETVRKIHLDQQRQRRGAEKSLRSMLMKAAAKKR